VALNSRATILMTLDGNHLRLPNALVFRSVTLNYTRNPSRRFQFDIGIGVNDDLVRAGHRKPRDARGRRRHRDPAATSLHHRAG